MKPVTSIRVADYVRVNLERYHTFRMEGPFQDEYQKDIEYNQSIVWFRNDYALSILVPDYMTDVWEPCVAVRGYKMIENPEPHQLSPIGVGWEPVTIPGKWDHFSIDDCGLYEVLEYARSLSRIR